MGSMTRPRKPKHDQPEPSDASGQPERKRYPSRENTRYVAVPLDLYTALESYAKSRSDQDDVKSITWAARVAIRRFLEGQGLWPPTPGNRHADGASDSPLSGSGG